MNATRNIRTPSRNNKIFGSDLLNDRNQGTIAPMAMLDALTAVQSFPKQNTPAAWLRSVKNSDQIQIAEFAVPLENLMQLVASCNADVLPMALETECIYEIEERQAMVCLSSTTNALEDPKFDSLFEEIHRQEAIWEQYGLDHSPTINPLLCLQEDAFTEQATSNRAIDQWINLADEDDQEIWVALLKKVEKPIEKPICDTRIIKRRWYQIW